MTDTSNVDPDSPAQAYPAAIIQAPLTVGDPDRAAKFLAEHRGRAQGAEDDFSRIMKQRQEAVAKTQAMLDQTIQELRDKHEGKGPGQVNLPLLAFGASMLSAPRPGVTSNFGTELGAGLKGLGAAVQTQRMGDTEFLKGVANLQAKSGQLSDVPLRDAASLAKARQIKEEGESGSIEKALIMSHGDKPIVNSQTGVTIFPNHFGQGQHGMMLPGKQDIVPLGAGTGQQTPAATGPASPEDDLKFLQQNISPDIKPGTMVHDIAYDKLAKIARQDPGLAGDLWDVINYNQDVKSITAQRGAKIDARELFRQARDIDPSFQPAMFQNVQKARNDWEGTGKQMQNQVQLQKTLNHMADGLGAAAALDNGNSQLVNAAKNKIAEWNGGAAPTNIKTVADILSKEMAKYFAGSTGAGGVEERRDLANMLSAAKSPQQLQGAIRYAMSLVRGQAQPLAAAKTVAYGNRKKYDMESLLDDSSKDSYHAVIDNDITTPKGRKALLDRLPPVTDAAPTGTQSVVPTYNPSTKRWE